MKEPWTGKGGYHHATTDPDQIAKWCKEKPTANIGLVPSKSGLVVLDVDPRNGGQAAYEALKAEIPELNVTRIVKTGSGGLQLYARGGVKAQHVSRNADSDLILGFEFDLTETIVTRSSMVPDFTLRNVLIMC